jgi:hypothetical protein
VLVCVSSLMTGCWDSEEDENGSDEPPPPLREERMEMRRAHAAPLPRGVMPPNAVLKKEAVRFHREGILSGQAPTATLSRRLSASEAVLRRPGTQTAQIARAPGRLGSADARRVRAGEGVRLSATQLSVSSIGRERIPTAPLTRTVRDGVLVSFCSYGSTIDAYRKYAGRFSYELEEKTDADGIGGRVIEKDGSFVLHSRQYEPSTGLRVTKSFELNPESRSHRKLAEEMNGLERHAHMWNIWRPVDVVGFDDEFFVDDLSSYDVTSFAPHIYVEKTHRLVAPYAASIAALLDRDKEVFNLMTDDGAYDVQPVKDFLKALSELDQCQTRSVHSTLFGYDPIHKISDLWIGTVQYDINEVEPPYRIRREVKAHLLMDTERESVLDIAIIVSRIRSLQKD